MWNSTEEIVQDLIIWDREYNLGIAEIDSQHKHLAALINCVIDTVQKLKPREEQLHSIVQVQKYTTWHFMVEERLMELYNYPGLKEHKEEHADLLKILNEKIRMFENDKKLNSGEFLSFFTGWFEGHAFGFDREMCAHLILVRKYMEQFQIE